MNPHRTEWDEVVKTFRWTRETFRRMATHGLFPGRVELVRGEVFEMTPVNWPHVVARSKTADRLRDLFSGVGWVNEQSPMPILESEPEPDVAVYPGQLSDYADHPTNPLLLVEIADSSLFYDTTTKAELYAEAGVADYWVLDLSARELLVFRDPQPVEAGGWSYRGRRVVPEGGTVTPLAIAVAVAVCDLLP